MDHEAPPPRIIQLRRRHSRAFKELGLAECLHSGEPIAGVALRHGINANLIHKMIILRLVSTSVHWA